jgi:hypothetical protein
MLVEDFYQILNDKTAEIYDSADVVGMLNVMARLVNLGFFEELNFNQFSPTREIEKLDHSKENLDFICAIIEPVLEEQESVYRLILQINKKVLFMASKPETVSFTLGDK